MQHDLPGGVVVVLQQAVDFVIGGAILIDNQRCIVPVLPSATAMVLPGRNLFAYLGAAKREWEMRPQGLGGKEFIQLARNPFVDGQVQVLQGHHDVHVWYVVLLAGFGLDTLDRVPYEHCHLLRCPQ